jgi:CRISPR-associated exonuclease Cas4
MDYKTTELPDYLPISMLNQLEYCARRFWLMFVCGEMDVNAPVLEGTLQHERAHIAGTSTEGDVVSRRRMLVGSERLRLSGMADVIELRPLPPAPSPDEKSWERRSETILVPVEYKHGRMGKWSNDEVQLCAQALCLEEQLALTPAPLSLGGGGAGGEGRIPYGEIFYWGSRRRVRVEFTPELRARTEATVQRAFELLEKGELPAPLPKELRAKCRDCSLQQICLPDEVIRLSESRAVG